MAIKRGIGQLGRIRERHERGGDEPPLALGTRAVLRAGRDDGGKVLQHPGVLVVAQPQAVHRVAHAVAHQIGFARGEVAVVAGEQTGDEGGERLRVVFAAHRGDVVRRDRGVFHLRAGLI